MNQFYDFSVYEIPESTSGNIINDNEIQNCKISILLKNNENNSELLNFLAKIIQAIGLNLHNDCIIREFDLSENEKINISEIATKDEAKFIIGFGFSKKDILSQAILKNNNWNSFDNFELLLSYSLQDINTVVDHKRNLWVNLKNKF